MKKFLLGLTALVMALTLALSVAVAEASIPRVAALKDLRPWAWSK